MSVNGIVPLCETHVNAELYNCIFAFSDAWSNGSFANKKLNRFSFFPYLISPNSDTVKVNAFCAAGFFQRAVMIELSKAGIGRNVGPALADPSKIHAQQSNSFPSGAVNGLSGV